MNSRLPGVRAAMFPGLLSIALAGCQMGPVRMVGPQDHSEALLTAARAGHLQMFGEFSTSSVPVFVSRPAVSSKQHTFSEVGTDFDLSVDPTGDRLVFASTRHNAQPDLYLKAVDGVAVTQLTADPAADVQPAISPDGTRVAFASRRSGQWDIWIMSMQGGAPMQVTNGPAEDVHPSWSPDGKKLVYCSLPAGGGQWELWITDATSEGTKSFIGFGLFPEWSPVGDHIVYQRARERGSRWFSIWVMTLDDGEPTFPVELAAGAEEAMILPSWSPDGTRIVYGSSQSVVPLVESPGMYSGGTVMDIWMMQADGREKVRLTDGFSSNYGPAYAGNGRIFFTSNRGGFENVWSVIPPRGPLSPQSVEKVTRSERFPSTVVPAATP